MKHNILYLHETSILGGAEKSLLNLVERLDKKIFNPLFICPQKGIFADELKKLNIKCYFVDFPRIKHLLSLAGCRAIKKIIHIIKKESICLVHSNGTGTNLIGALSAKLTGIFSIWHARNILSKRMWDSDRFFSFLPDKILCNSEAIRKRFIKRGKLHPKIITIINGVDINAFSPDLSSMKIRQEFSVDEGEVIIGMLSRIDMAKGQDYFIEAAAQLNKQYPHTWFLIVGSPCFSDHCDFFKQLKDEVQRLQLEKKVIFTGFRKDVVDILVALDILVLASEAEACGRVLFEAMACGRPIVATNTGGTPEIVVDKETGLLIPPKDSQALVSALRVLLDNKERREKMGQMGRRRVEKYFTIQEHVKKTEAVYKELLNKN